MMQVSLVPEVPFAGGAKVVYITVMFMEFCVAVENLFIICFICRASRGEGMKKIRKTCLLAWSTCVLCMLPESIPIIKSDHHALSRCGDRCFVCSETVGRLLI